MPENKRKKKREDRDKGKVWRRKKREKKEKKHVDKKKKGKKKIKNKKLKLRNVTTIFSQYFHNKF